MMMKKYRLVSEEDLIELLTDANTMLALERGGVDNWEWYSESTYNFIQTFLENHENELNLSEDELEDFSIRDIAECDVEMYQAIMI